MNTIEEAMRKEESLMNRLQKGKYTKKDVLKNDIEDLLDHISSSHSSINTIRKLRWVCNAIIRWESFLASEFSICKTTPIPTIESLPHMEEDVTDREQSLAEQVKRTLEQSIKRTLEQCIKGEAAEVQYLLKEQHVETHEAIMTVQDYLMLHHKKMNAQHVEQQLLGPTGKPYHLEEHEGQESYYGYPRISREEKSA